MSSSAIIDCQVHAYERDHQQRPWLGTLAGPAEATGEQMIAAMDAVGVDGALLVSPWSLYRFDASYALEVGACWPGRFGLISPFDPADPAVAEAVAEWAGLPGTVGARVLLDERIAGAPASLEGVDRIVAAAGEHNLPVNVLGWGQLDAVAGLAARHPHHQIVLDHLGLRQPFHPPPPTDPWAELPAVLALAQYDNLAIKISGACTLSHTGYPFADIWPPLLKIFDAFGLQRCLWGTDWTRAIELVSYEQAVTAFTTTPHLTDSDRTQLMGGSVSAVYGFVPWR